MRVSRAHGLQLVRDQISISAREICRERERRTRGVSHVAAIESAAVDAREIAREGKKKIDGSPAQRQEHDNPQSALSPARR